MVIPSSRRGGEAFGRARGKVRGAISRAMVRTQMNTFTPVARMRGRGLGVRASRPRGIPVGRGIPAFPFKVSGVWPFLSII